MKIGVLSDTHLKFPDSRLDHILQELFRAYDMILHAGDIVSGAVLERLEEKGVLDHCPFRRGDERPRGKGRPGRMREHG